MSAVLFLGPAHLCARLLARAKATATGPRNRRKTDQQRAIARLHSIRLACIERQIKVVRFGPGLHSGVEI